ncbi:MDR family MFS transporter [Micromonospora zamorensis]|uniref:MFS transporter n=1 Tax=Micromonospora zamorensis TaxID=709883 RepID=A0ABZ1PFD4_9ACTN|nr:MULTISPECIES: MDR family MFS transporter [Micromonospora]MBQ0978882.1 MFS transporter [Micromonospora sp. M61]MBQ1039700.1 MFS transporter [Micromonospora sp. C81]WSK50950.1 MFS transporter [Micromonospora zamorensis]WTE86496.1 MFS transporter [Micromonospora zamorensis]WTI21266.1 MFS transporter [Micromonospora zamorensis]
MTQATQAGVRPNNIRVVLFGLMIAMMLAMLDNMIVSTALPRIVGEFGGLNHFTWVVTAYVLGTTVSTPIWGKLGDLYGRKSVFLTSVVVFLVGSALCGMAGSGMLGGPQDGMVQLIAFRAVQGLGAGGLMVGVMAIIGDLVPPRERGRYQGMIAGIMAIAMVAGPLAGGFITDHLSWRWAFYVNLPLGGIALLVLMTTMHLPKYRTEHRIDWLGAGLLSVGITAIVLITTWGGNEYDWTSPQIFGLAVLAVLALVAFGLVERRVQEPILPLALFANRNFALISVIGFLLGFAMFGAMNFLPLYQQTVQGASATNSGLLLLPLMFGMLVVSLVIGRAITRNGRYRAYPIIGGVVMTAGMALLSMLDTDTSKLMSSLYMVVLGVGMGFLMQTSMLIAQNSVEQKDLGAASGAATFFRSIGGSFGISLFGAIFANRLASSEGGRAFGGESGGSGMDLEKLKDLPAQARDMVLGGLSDAISHVFLWAVLFTIVIPVLAWFIKEIPLRTANEAPPQATPEEEAEVALGKAAPVA